MLTSLLFDFDGVILDTEWPIYLSMQRVFREHGHELPLHEYVQCIGSDFRTWSPETHLEELTGKTFDWSVIGIERNAWIRSEIEKLDAMPGVRETLRYCKAEKIPCAVVSSSSHDWVDRWLEKLDLTDFFEFIIAREDAPRIKPAPDLYLEAVRLLERPASECLVIEDSHNGLLAAHAAGCPVVAIPNRITAEIDFSDAEHRADSLTHFLENLVPSLF